MIKNAGMDLIKQLLIDNLKHVGLATGSTTDITSTKLVGEVIRKQVSEQMMDDDVLVTEVYLDETEGNNISLKSIGLMIGVESDQIGEGDLFLDFSIDEIKTDTETMTISIEIEVLEVD